MAAIEDSPHHNVILFPKSVEYYQIELTRMLENEQYQEAIQLLRFLLQCQEDDPRTHGEWKALLDWLQTTFPEEVDSQANEEIEEVTEADLLKQHVLDKLEQDPQYAKGLLDMLLHNPSIEKKLLALNQLTFVDHPQINETLKRWVANVDLHPLVQFKVLQTLCNRGSIGEVLVHKCGEEIRLNIEETPQEFAQFPQQLCYIMHRVVEVSEVKYPALSYFAEQTWKDFLCYVYGTSMYNQLLKLDEEDLEVWAAALHHVVTETMIGFVEEAETLELYQISKERKMVWAQAYNYIKSFIGSAFRAN